MEYHYQVCKWDDEGVPFRTYLYVPEIHPITKEPFLEREDEGHVFKVCMKLDVYYIIQNCAFAKLMGAMNIYSN